MCRRRRRFRTCWVPRRGSRYLHVGPSKKALQRERDKLTEMSDSMAVPRNANLRAAAQANLIRPRYANGALVSPADVENLHVRFHEGTVSPGLIRCSPSYSLAPYGSGRTQMFRNFMGVSVTADGSGPAT